MVRETYLTKKYLKLQSGSVKVRLFQKTFLQLSNSPKIDGISLNIIKTRNINKI